MNDSFENYLLFMGAVNAGFALFSQLRETIIQEIDKLLDEKKEYYSFLVAHCEDITNPTCDISCNKDCRHKEPTLENESTVKKAQSDISRTLDEASDSQKSRTRFLENISIALAILSILIISFILCFNFTEDIAKNTYLKAFSLFFVSPISIMSFCFLWHKFIPKKYKNIETNLEVSYCKKILKQARKNVKESKSLKIKSIVSKLESNK